MSALGSTILRRTANLRHTRHLPWPKNGNAISSYAVTGRLGASSRAVTFPCRLSEHNISIPWELQRFRRGTTTASSLRFVSGAARRKKKKLKATEKESKEEMVVATHIETNTDGMTVPFSEAKQVFNIAKQKFKFTSNFVHNVEGPSHEPLFCATMTASFPPNLLVLMTIPDKDSISQHESISLLDNGNLQIMTTAAAGNKKTAEAMATADCISILYQECGLDLRNPPTTKKPKSNNTSSQLQIDEEDFQASVAKAQMILELAHASRPQFETIPEPKNAWTATASCFLMGRAITVKGEPGTSKARAEGNALIEMVAPKTGPLVDIVGEDAMNEWERLIQESPAQHVAPLWIDPLPDEIFQSLVDAIGTKEDHIKRMELHELTKEEYEFDFAQRHPHSRQSQQGRNNNQRFRSPDQIKAINQALQREEEARHKKIEGNPGGKEAKMKALRDALPISKIRQDLIDALKAQQVVVVSGGTGSGKSTQCPQYILEDAIAHDKGAETQIIVTQPRRIAAISVAERIAAERHELLGNSVGYNVRFKREAPRDTGGTVEFVTTGLLLRRLMSDPTLQDCSHVMIDEVHERDINTDFLLILLRDLLEQRPDLRVILMSATLDAESFGEYFSQGKAQNSNANVPVLSVPTEPRHPVEVVYLEDLALETEEGSYSRDLTQLAKALLDSNDQKLNLELEEAKEEEEAARQLEAISCAEDEGKLLDSDSDSDDDAKTTESRLTVLKRAVSMRGIEGSSTSSVGSMAPKRKQDPDFDSGDAIISLTVKLAQHLGQELTDAGREGSVLCFLPGWDEIKIATAELEESTNRSLKRKMKILPLHSTIPQEDQQKVFEPAEPGTVKIILATNLAESSVTIGDVLAVVDSGLVRELNFDSESGMSKMETPQTSRSSATQRLGRAGRVAPGHCYRLYSRGDFEAMSERPTPEIQRTGLEDTCLRTCSMTSTGVEAFLHRALDPPAEEAVSFAMNRLMKLGAITYAGSNQGGDQVLTPLGRLLSRLPLNPEVGRMLLMGVTLKCLSPCLTAAAASSSRNVFNNPVGLRDEAGETRKSFSQTSDILATMRAFDFFWDRVERDGWRQAGDWAFDNFISVGAMVSIKSVRMQLLRELINIGMVPKEDLIRIGRSQQVLHPSATVDRNADNELLFSAVWASGNPSNLACRRKHAFFGTLRTRTESHAGLHPSSVAFHRKPPKQRGVKPPLWYSYNEIVLSSQVFLRGVSVMTPEQIILFAGYPNTTVEGDKVLFEGSDVRGVLDGWIAAKGRCAPSVDLLLAARGTCNAALEHKIMSPRQPLPEEFEVIVDAVSDMYESLGKTTPQGDYDDE